MIMDNNARWYEIQRQAYDLMLWASRDPELLFMVQDIAHVVDTSDFWRYDPADEMIYFLGMVNSVFYDYLAEQRDRYREYFAERLDPADSVDDSDLWED